MLRERDSPFRSDADVDAMTKPTCISNRGAYFRSAFIGAGSRVVAGTRLCNGRRHAADRHARGRDGLHIAFFSGRLLDAFELRNTLDAIRGPAIDRGGTRWSDYLFAVRSSSLNS